MIIEGCNLGKEEVEYKNLSDWLYFDDERQELVKKIEQLYFNILNESKCTKVARISQEDNHIVLNSGMLNHRCSNSIDSLRNISKYGILASEWFGLPESEQEGTFCAFIDRIHDEVTPADPMGSSRGAILNKQRLNATKSRHVLLFLDESNPAMQKLLHWDFFEYEKIKTECPEKLSTIYTPEEIEIFDEIIEPFSPGGKDFHKEGGMLPYRDWSAIPGGIPSTLVNGICIKTLPEYDKEYIGELLKLFPNATIFNGELEVIYTPIKEESKLTPLQQREAKLSSLQAEEKRISEAESLIAKKRGKEVRDIGEY